jgi:hypothetical protein
MKRQRAAQSKQRSCQVRWWFRRWQHFHREQCTHRLPSHPPLTLRNLQQGSNIYTPTKSNQNQQQQYPHLAHLMHHAPEAVHESTKDTDKLLSR